MRIHKCHHEGGNFSEAFSQKDYGIISNIHHSDMFFWMKCNLQFHIKIDPWMIFLNFLSCLVRIDVDGDHP